MPVITIVDITESNHLKEEACNDIISALKDDFTTDELKVLENVFNSVAEKYTFKRRE